MPKDLPTVLLIGRRGPNLTATEDALRGKATVRTVHEGSEAYLQHLNHLTLSADFRLAVDCHRMLPINKHTPTFVIHGSILPQWRGFAPVSNAIRFGVPGTELGATCFQAVEEMDAGPIVATRSIGPNGTMFAYEVADEMPSLHSLLTNDLLRYWRDGGKLFPQENSDFQPSYGGPLLPCDRQVDWRDSAEKISRVIRSATTSKLEGVALLTASKRYGPFIPENAILLGRHEIRMPSRTWTARPGQVLLPEAKDRDEVPVWTGGNCLLVFRSFFQAGAEVPACSIIRNTRERLL